MLKKLAPFAQAAAPAITGGLAGLILAGMFELLQPWPVKWLVDYVLGRHALPEFLRRWLPSLGDSSLVHGALTVCLCVLLFACAHKVAQFLSNLFLLRGGEHIVFQIRCRAFDQLQRLSLVYHDKTRVGESLYRVAYDAHAAQTMLAGFLAPVLTGIIMLCGILAIMARIDPAMTLITLAAAPLFFITIKLFGRRIESDARRYHESETSLVSALQEALMSIRTIQTFTMESTFGVRFHNQASQSRRNHEKLMSAQLLFAGVVGIAMAAGTAGVIWVGAHRVEQGRLLAGDVLVFLAYLGMLYQPVNAFCQSAATYKSAGTQLARVFEVLDTAPAIANRPDARELAEVKGRVEFRAVGFGYEPGRPVLNAISFTIPAQSVVAVVGRTGAGKTTLASLLTRFYDPSEGEIHLDGHDLRALKVEWLRQQVSVVLQDPILFSGTIRENIAVGRPGASFEEIQAAARRAQIHGDIERFPDGYETILGERGVNLSGGQRQRLSIARALLKNAPILVLDEPTSSLDPRTESDLLNCLRELVRGRTTFIIAHRLTTLSLADQILLLDEGRVVDMGSHEELLQRDELYQSIYETYWHMGSARVAGGKEPLATRQPASKT
jgi:ATP-binding cassette subfamily B protein/subfamily B ATP-binding cassette protein MsbA